MTWVKRNIIFIIVMVLGLGATGYCGYLLYGIMGANSGLGGEYADAVKQVEDLRKGPPPPTPENISAATADQERVKEFLRTFKKSFAPFPVAKSVDDRGFVEHLTLMERQFALEATNAGVQLPNDYHFSFAGEQKKVSFSAECLDPLMQEMEEVNMILRLLYAAKINYLEELQRIPACQDDNSGEDILFTSSISNQWGLVTPYKVSFRGFSTEVASVLMAFANSSNCFVVKYLTVRPSQAPLPVVTDDAGNPQPQPQYMQPEYAPPMDDEDGGGRRMRRRRPMPQQMMPTQPAQPTGPSPPETILRELPLYVTIVVDVVKLSAPAPEPTNAPAVRGGRSRGR
jgi:hypothetical protein